MKACSFTGHRVIENRHASDIKPLVARAINYAYNEGCRVFYTGGALGFDTVAAREVILFRMSHPDVKLVLVLPCLGQDEHWKSSQKDAYEYILGSADEVRYCSEKYFDGCMRERNRVLAELCDILVSYVGHARSGSSQTVRMAERMGKRIYNLYPALEAKAKSDANQEF